MAQGRRLGVPTQRPQLQSNGAELHVARLVQGVLGGDTGVMRAELSESDRTPRRTGTRPIAIAGTLVAALTIALGGCSSGTDESGHDDSERATEEPTDATEGPSDTTADTRQPDPTTARVSVVHRTPTCGCCKDYEEYLREHGYRVESVVSDDLAPVRAEHGIPEGAASCHTTIVGGYAVEGHVPVEAIEALLAEQPDVQAIALPGMPANSPGMGEPNGEPLEVVAIDVAGRIQPFMTL